MNKNYRKLQIKKGILPGLCLGLILSISSCLAIYSFSQPKQENKISFLLGAKDYRKEEFTSKLDSLNLYEIYEYDFTCYESSSNFFLSYYASSIGSVDITIIPSSITELGIFASNIGKYLCFDEDIVAELGISSWPFYLKDGKRYGLEVFNINTGDGIFKEYVEYEDFSYYLFVSLSSKQLGKDRNNIFTFLQGAIKS